MRTLRYHALSGLVGLIACAALAESADAASITYVLNQTNADAGSLLDGTQFGTVTIDNDIANSLRFTVTLSTSLTSIAGSNFGIDNFAFNVTGANPLQDFGSVPGQWSLPSGWAANVAPPPNQMDGFGRFEAAVDGSGSARQTTLVFSVNNIALDLYRFAELSTNNAGQGNVFFSMHVAGFNGPNGISSAYFGGSTEMSPVPLPAGLPLLLSGLLGGFAWLRKVRVAV